jgi:cytochrome bd-type quinol oxidase subunit 2
VERGTVNPKVVGSSPTIGVIQSIQKQGERMLSETVLGVLFCFFLPLAVAARFWHWYTFFKRGQKIKLAKQMLEEQVEK